MMLRVACCALAALACGDDDPGTEVSDTRDVNEVETEVAETEAEVETTVEVETNEVADIEVVTNEWGFPIRTPANHTLACEDSPVGDLDTLETDWLCTFVHGGVDTMIYAANTPTACDAAFFPVPIFGEGAGWMALAGGQTKALSDVSYDWGGNHHNDSLSFTVDQKKYRYYHSSFGFGFRKCQEMDCLQVRDLAGEILEDGCTTDRTLPVVCQQVTVDGTWGDFTDTFAKCNGDPNVP